MSAVCELIERVPIRIAPLDDAVAVAAARLRAAHRTLKLPDAAVIATAEVLDADRLVTTDRAWPPAKALGLPAEIERL